VVGRLDAAPGKQEGGVRELRPSDGRTLVGAGSYLDLRPLESEAVAGVRVWVRVEARAEEE